MTDDSETYAAEERKEEMKEEIREKEGSKQTHGIE